MCQHGHLNFYLNTIGLHMRILSMPTYVRKDFVVALCQQFLQKFILLVTYVIFFFFFLFLFLLPSLFSFHGGKR